VSDDFETLLRDHFRNAAEGIHPEPETIERARAAGRRRERGSRWRLRMRAMAIGSAGLAAAAAMTAVFVVPDGSPAGRRVGPAARRAAEPTIHADRTTVRAGREFRISGTATGRVTVFLRTGRRWTEAGEVMPADGRYAAAVVASEGAGAVRVCLAGSSFCSVPLSLEVSPPESPASTATPTPIPAGAAPPYLVRTPTAGPATTPTPVPTPPTPAMSTPLPRP
jgi:hypothetical protein